MQRNNSGELHGSTDRLHLRPWRTDEAELLLEIRRILELAKWLGDPTPWTTIDEAERFITTAHDICTDDSPLGRWAVVPKTTGIPVGTVSLVKMPDETEVELGWYLNPEHTGKGYASEAAAAVLAHGLASNVHQIWAIMWPENKPSAGVAERIGMTNLGVKLDKWYGTAEYPDSLMFIAPGKQLNS